MKIKVFQISKDKDTNNVKFKSLDEARKRNNSVNIDPSIYLKVFDGEVPCESLEEVYRLFNAPSRPKGFTGHSLSVSDVVEVEDQRLYVDTLGFKVVEFLPLYVFRVNCTGFKPCADQVTNAIMFALDGMRVTENSLKFALWRLRDFFGQGIPEHKQKEWGKAYDEWVKQSPRVQIGEYSYPYQLPNIALGYTSCETLVEKLQKKGEIIIPLDSVFDPRQSIRANFKGCTLSVKRVD